jgi:outer membrane protein assembly factor BamB
MNIHQEEHDNTSFKRTIIRADTTNVANGSNYSYNALGAILGSLRINPVEPSAFRSQYIGPKVDVAQIEKNPSFGSWIAAAKTKMNASDLLVGTTNIYQRGLNNMGQNKCSAVQAIRVFDTTTGKEVWRTGKAPEQGYVPPSIIEAAGVRQLVLVKPDAVYAVEPETGKLLWETPYNADNGSIIMTPVRVGDHLYIGGYQVGFGPISWLIISEIFPLQVRGKAVSLAVVRPAGQRSAVSAA